jgi:prepilin-type N-terminal cleavage/methylation domain-containing protein
MRGSSSWAGIRAFSLVELLVVLAIIVVLIATLMPSLQKARSTARRTVCAAQLHQVHIAATGYAAEHRLRNLWLFDNGSADYPWESGHATQPGSPARALHLTGHLPNGRLFFCPSAGIDPARFYHHSPSGDYTKFHGSYAWYFQKTAMSDRSRLPGNANGILWASPASASLVYADYYWSLWNSLSFEPDPQPHFNALTLGGGVDLLPHTTDDQHAVWLWGPSKNAY